jgi:hypothetical protein
VHDEVFLFGRIDRSRALDLERAEPANATGDLGV